MKKYFLSILLITSNMAFCQNFEQTQRLVNSDSDTSDWFGTDSSISGNFAIVGAMFEDQNKNGEDTLNNFGSAYIYERDNSGLWHKVQKITARDRAEKDDFGRSVGIDGNIAVVGAERNSTDEFGNNFMNSSGAVYVFERDSRGKWNQVKKLVASDRDIDDWFGFNVAISGDYIVAQGYRDSENENGENFINHSGSIYIYKNLNNDWIPIQKIVANDRGYNDYFGIGLDIDGDYIVAGSNTWELDKSGAQLEDAGSFYVFKNNSDSWTQIYKGLAPVISAGDRFGSSVSIDGDYIVVGSPNEDEDSNNENYINDSGSSYIYKNNDDVWEFEQKITSNKRTDSNYFGNSVSISEDTIVISAPSENEDENDEMDRVENGSVFVFQKNEDANWVQSQEIASLNRSESVNISNDFIIVSGHGEIEDVERNNSLSSTGSAYIFKNSSALNVEDKILNQGLFLYPNPVLQTLYIQSKIPIEMVEIYRPLGKTARELNYEYESVDLSDYISGTYYIRIRSKNGTAVREIIIQRNL